MARTKGAKNKSKVAIEGGNPDFNLNHIEPSSVLTSDIPSGAIMPEDLALEAKLQAMINEPAPISDPEPAGSVVKRTPDKREMLGDVLNDYTPASTDDELRAQVHLAKQEGCDSIEVTSALAKRFCRDPKLEEVGYFVYHDIKVYIAGLFEQSKLRDSMTVEQRTFGSSLIK